MLSSRNVLASIAKTGWAEWRQLGNVVVKRPATAPQTLESRLHTYTEITNQVIIYSRKDRKNLKTLRSKYKLSTFHDPTTRNLYCSALFATQTRFPSYIAPQQVADNTLHSTNTTPQVTLLTMHLWAAVSWYSSPSGWLLGYLKLRIGSFLAHIFHPIYEPINYSTRVNYRTVVKQFLCPSGFTLDTPQTTSRQFPYNHLPSPTRTNQ